MKPNKKIKELFEYCDRLSKSKYKDEWKRGYNCGVGHIRDQLKKILYGEKVGDSNTPDFM